jgi:hypothetical protein
MNHFGIDGGVPLQLVSVLLGLKTRYAATVRVTSTFFHMIMHRKTVAGNISAATSSSYMVGFNRMFEKQ